MSPSPSSRAVLYTRLSVARDGSTSMAGQADDLMALATAEGWEVVAAFSDDGVSGGKQRANADAALDMIADGRASILAVYAYDRWSREGIEKGAELIRTLRLRREQGNPARFVAVREGVDDDGSADDFDMRLSFAADLAKRERDRVRVRVSAGTRRLRAAGRFAGGTPPFGYRSAPHPRISGARTLIVHDEEAAIVREVAPRIISGESLVRIADDLTTRRVPRSRSPYRLAAIRLASANRTSAAVRARGHSVRVTLDTDGCPVAEDGSDLSRGTWDQSRVRDLWTSEHLLGRIVVDGAATLEEDGITPAQPFEAILDLPTHQAIRARFEGVTRGHQRKRRASRLLSGLVYCAGCEGRMYPRLSRDDAYYACSASARGVTCNLGHPRMKAELLEQITVDRFLARAGSVEEVEVIERAATDKSARLAELRTLIATTTSRLADRGVDRGEVLSRLDALQEEEARIESLPDAVTRERRATGRTVAEAWAEATAADEATSNVNEARVDSRRGILGAWIDHVVIDAARTRGHVVDEGRVRVEWAPEAEAAL